MLHLSVIRGPDRKEHVSVADRDLPFTIGRDRENKLHINATAVSRFHAVLFLDEGDYYVQDMDSTNGTFLNGKKVKKARVSAGDRIRIANVDVVVGRSRFPLDDAKAPLDLTVSFGKPIPANATITVSNPMGELSLEDVPEVERNEEDGVSRSYDALQVLYRADRVLRDIDDFKQLLENFMDLIFEVIPASRGYIFLINREEGLPVPYVRRAPAAVADDTEIVVSRTILQAAVKNKESLISNDALVDERFAHSRSVAEARVRSAMCAPLLNRGKVLGIIYLDSTDKSNLYRKEDLALLSAMALKAGIALDNARLYDDLRNMFFNTVETLVRAIQARDPYTSGHSGRVSRYCLQVADKLGLSTRDKQNVYLTSLLHDIGKIGIPDELLNKPEKLNENETAQVREHVKMGAEMLKAMGEMSAVVPLILHHHECWDGSGYPDGLKGEEIPLISRIIAVADTYDAMTSDRPYRGALTKDEAVAELRRCAGTQFDPRVVEVFIRVVHQQSTAEINKTAPSPT